MARRRMFSPDVVCTDNFNDMPVSAQNLYTQLGMNIDDDGFVSPKRIMRTVNANEDDLKILIAKGYLIPFETGVVVLAHHRINNLIRKDWYKPTQYQEEAKLLCVEKGQLIRLKESVNELVNESRYRTVTIINKLTNNKGENTGQNTGNYKVEEEAEFQKMLEEEKGSAETEFEKYTRILEQEKKDLANEFKIEPINNNY